MLWIPIAIGSYFLSALASIIDKILLRGRIPNPLAFAFYTGISSIGVLVLIPFGFSFLSLGATLLAFLAGAAFLSAFIFLYTGLRYGEASRVVPLIGALTPLMALGLTYLFGGTGAQSRELLAILFFVLGGFLISLEADQRGGKHFDGSILFVSLLAAFSMGVMFAVSKAVYERADFFPAFIWMRMGSSIAALGLLCVASFRRSIFASARALRVSSGGALVFNKILGACAFLALNYSISLGSESVVSAMRGFEFLFVFAIAYVLSKRFPRVLSESFDLHTLLYKIVGIALIAAGFYRLIY